MGISFIDGEDKVLTLNYMYLQLMWWVCSFVEGGTLKLLQNSPGFLRQQKLPFLVKQRPQYPSPAEIVIFLWLQYFYLREQ